MRKVYTENLPNKYKSGKSIDWFKSIGKVVHFIYDDISGDFEINNYDVNKQIISINYKNDLYQIKTDSLLKSRINNILNNVNIKDKIKLKVGAEVIDNKRNLTVTNNIYYGTRICQVKCNICGWDGGVASEWDIINHKYSCSCCYGNIVVEGINDIPTTAPWMIPYFQGGYDEAKLYTYGSNKKVYMKCPDCKKISSKPIKICDLYSFHSIGCICSDGISYPEKFMINLLSQINIEFIYQLTKSHLNWVNKYKYDFYIPSLNCIIETHGEQHYERSFSINPLLSVEDQQHIDYLKEKLAIDNGIINYITVDCRYSKLDWIKDSIYKTNLTKLINLSNIIWEDCNKYAYSNLVRSVCEYQNKHTDLTSYELANLFKLDNTTIIKYLHVGNQINLCKYDPKAALRKGARKTAAKRFGYLYVYKDDVFIGKFESIQQFIDKSVSLLGIKFSRVSISLVINGKQNDTKGYKFIRGND